ncbi:hypothetical protein JOE49_000438 [Paenibacillus sp. PvR133]|nr:hypothetical protein [Paenibacillus sp. PvR133]MBP1173186.1 hypothetical protein [Paenibacillus sp. PvR133]
MWKMTAENMLLHDFRRFRKDEAGAKRMTEISFENGLIIERAGRGDCVLKIMPPLTVSMEHLAAGCDIIKSSMQQVISQETQDLLVTKAGGRPGKRHGSAFWGSCGPDVKITFSSHWKIFSPCCLRYRQAAWNSPPIQGLSRLCHTEHSLSLMQHHCHI